MRTHSTTISSPETRWGGRAWTNEEVYPRETHKEINESSSGDEQSCCQGENMTGVKDLRSLLLIAALLLTGASQKNEVTFVYSTIGSDVLLPCTKQPPGCAGISWAIYKSDQIWNTQEVDGNSSSRISISSDCSLSIRQLSPDDAGAYVCLLNGRSITDVYLSLLTVSSASTVTELRAGGTLSLSCLLFTYYNAGSCRSYSNNVFKLSWATEDGAELTPDERHKVVVDSPCNVTLLLNLQREDHNKKWRCQANTQEPGKPVVRVFQDFASTLLLHGPQTEEKGEIVLTCSSSELPISRIVLCVALPFMVAIVGVYTWKVDRHCHHHRTRTKTSRYELKEIS